MLSQLINFGGAIRGPALTGVVSEFFNGLPMSVRSKFMQASAAMAHSIPNFDTLISGVPT